MIAIIPARGGSKGLPGKNIKMLLGLPMIAYTIQEALKSKYISEVFISTDDQKIASVATDYGALCPFMRPSDLATDFSKAIDTYLFTLDRLESERGVCINEFVVLQPTSPLRVVEDIDNAIKLFLEKKADSVVSITELSHPIEWCKFLNEQNQFIPIFEETINNRQLNKKAYYPTGAVYVFSKELIRAGKYYSQNSFGYIMPRNRSIDVDTNEDFELAEFLLKKRHEK